MKSAGWMEQLFREGEVCPPVQPTAAPQGVPESCLALVPVELWGTKRKPVCSHSFVDGERRQLTTFEYHRFQKLSKATQELGNIVSYAEFLYIRGFYDTCLDYIEYHLLRWPRSTDLKNARGIVHYKKGEYSEAVMAFREALVVEGPVREIAKLNLAKSLDIIGRQKEGISILEGLQNNDEVGGIACLELSDIFRRTKLWHLARRFAMRANQMLPYHGRSACNFAYILAETGKSDVAKLIIDRLIEEGIREYDIEPHLYAVLKKTGQSARLLNILQNVPRHIKRRYGLQYEEISEARTVGDRARFKELLEKAIEENQKDSYLRAQRVLLNLAEGKGKLAFRDYEWRVWATQSGSIRREAEEWPVAFWNGQRLDDSGLLVLPEQGVGDQIMFSRFLCPFQEEGNKAIVAVDQRLVPLWERSFPSLNIIDRNRLDTMGSKRLRIDYQIHMGSMGRFYGDYLFKSNLSVPYIQEKEELVHTLRSKYVDIAKGRRIIGLSWHSANERLRSKKNPNDTEWEPLFRRNDALVINLQYGKAAFSLNRLSQMWGGNLFTDESVNQLKSMEAFYAQVSAVDAVVSVCNTAMHVAGSLAKDTFLLTSIDLPLLSAVERNGRSVWYPSVRILYKHRNNTWRDIIRQCVMELSHGV